MKKSIAILLALSVLITSAFVACKKQDDSDEDTAISEQGIEDANDEYGFEVVPATDKDGKEVTDKNGKTVTTEVAVKYEVDKKGKTVAVILNSKGDPVTKKNGKSVTVKTDIKLTTKAKTKKSKKKKKTTTKKASKSTKATTVPTKKGDKTTEPEITTKKNTERPPKTSDKGERVVFSEDDQQIIKSMLEVPYLYNTSYENADGVPIEAAAHAALWMLQREGISTKNYAAGTVVIDLFKYFGQTVINFKTKVNEEGKTENLVYKSQTDTFSVSDYEPETHSVTIDNIQSMGYGNYYKVEGTAKLVDGGKKKVIAIIQRNRLDNSLGFSIKALKWK